MFDRILIANRGEIACRVIRSCRRLGIRAIAVYSDADEHALHVREADEAIRIGGPRPVDSYLSTPRVIEAARSGGAQAIHPGYGFLSENEDFARACLDAGLVFIGPDADTIRIMGSKSAAKRLMERAGVPVVPGYHGEDQSEPVLRAEARGVGFPLLIKAVAGGGGKGMRIVRSEREFAESLAAARREARNAFDDDAVLLERYIEAPRHIEFQVFGDRHGNVVHLFERECSLQRRHQKVLEESPSPFLDDALRERMADAAVAAARAVEYVNAGTIEFIVGNDRQFYFMEMNTRLQVEHPVTEMITGLDLVEWQLRVAAGEPLPLAQSQITCRGHAIEARLYAEDPSAGFMPSTGRVVRFAHPPRDSNFRLEAAVEDGDTVTAHYDPMIAKLVVRAEDRSTALARLRHTLAHCAVFGPKTNLSLLRGIVRDPDVLAGTFDTGLIEHRLEALLARPAPLPKEALMAAAARTLIDRQTTSAFEGRKAAVDPGSPWNVADAWQANGRGATRLAFTSLGRVELRAAGWGGAYRLAIDGETTEFAARELAGDELELIVNRRRQVVTVFRYDRHLQVVTGDQAVELQAEDPFPVARHLEDEAVHPGSPLPGRVVAVGVESGQRVEEGEALVVIEGMKMEHTVRARVAGTVLRVLVAEGDAVEAEAPLVEIEPEEVSASD